MVNAYTADYNPCPSRLTSNRYIPVYWWTLSLFRIFAYFSLKPVYPTMTGKTYGVQVTGKCNFESKNWI